MCPPVGRLLSQARVTPLLAAALGLAPKDLDVLSCTLDVIVPPPMPPPMAPDAPVLYRKPYNVWKAALIGGLLGGVFLLEVIVLAVRGQSNGLFLIHT